MQKENIIEEALLAKFLSGEATAEEAMTVNDWIARSEENRLHYAQVEKAWSLNASVDKTRSAKELVWNNLQSSLGKQKRQPTRFAIPYRIAAGIFLLLAVGIGIYFFRPGTQGDLIWNSKQTTNEIINLNLPDGSAVTINRNSRIQWPKESGGDVREVRLEGEAFFDVAHNPAQPFIVATDDIRIKVLGTAFNVSNDTVGNIETEVVRGKVMMYNSKSKLIIEAGMIGRYNKATGQFELVQAKNENNLAYATHSLLFESATLKDVCDQLAKTYGTQFVFGNETVEHCTLTSEYHNKSLAFIMNVISESLGIQYEIKGDTVFISGNGCR